MCFVVQLICFCFRSRFVRPGVDIRRRRLVSADRSSSDGAASSVVDTIVPRHLRSTFAWSHRSGRNRDTYLVFSRPYLKLGTHRYFSM